MIRCPLIMLVVLSLVDFSVAQTPSRSVASMKFIHERERRVFDSLDLNRPELSAVAEQWRKGDFAGTEKAFATYLRNRDTVSWGAASRPFQGRLTDNDLKVAEDAVNGSLQGGLVPVMYAFPNGAVDWHFNATNLPGQTRNNEWQWQLNRMQFWSSLSKAYRATNDERYATAFEAEMLSWIVQCPVPDKIDNVPGSAWRSIEAGIRAGGAWPEAFFAFRNAPSMSDADLILFVSGFLDHGRYLRANNTRLNWLTMEMSGLYAVGALFPEFTEAPDWRRYAVKRLAEEAERQFLPDGAQVELSTGYQNVALQNIVKVKEIAGWTRHESELPANYSAPLSQAYEYQIGLMTPDRLLPKINDSWPVYLPSIFVKASQLFPERQDFEWVATDGIAGEPPSYSSVFLNRAGLAVMRSGWKRQDNELVFRMGPLGLGHIHQDKLEVLVWAYGRELIFNGGGGSYEKSKWRDWAVSTYAANSVIVDGLSQSRSQAANDPFHDPNMISQRPIDAHWISNPIFDFASGTYNQGYGPQHLEPAKARREILFLKPDLYLVVDRFTPNDKKVHQYQVRWQLLTTHTALDSETQFFTTRDRNSSNVVIVPLRRDGLTSRAVSAQESPEILGWDVRKDVTPKLVPATTLLQTMTGAGPKTVINLLLPLRSGEANPVVRVEKKNNPLDEVIVFANGDRLTISTLGVTGLDVEENAADGQTKRSAHVDPY